MIPDRSELRLVAEAINIALERHFWRWSLLFVALLFICSIARDIRVKMWTDELITLYNARQGSVSDILHATTEGCDGVPPLYAIIVHSILPVIRHEALAVRLPSTLGYCGMVLCLLALCHRRLPAVYAWISMVFACGASLHYSTEGRPYGIVLCCCAGALLCLEAANDRQHGVTAILLLAVCLMLMTALHYYSIFFLVPLFLAELMRQLTSRRWNFAILAAMASPLLVLGLHYPLIAAGRSFQFHFWSPATWSQIPSFYNTFLLPQLGLCSSVALLVLAVFPASAENRASEGAGLPLHDWVAMATLAVMPPFVIVVSRYTTHAFVDRYVLWAVIGFAVLVGALLCAAARRQVIVGVVVLGALISLLAIREIGRSLRTPVADTEKMGQELARLTSDSEQVVVEEVHVFMELSYYAEPHLRERLVYPINRELELRHRGYDSASIRMSALRNRSKLHILDYDVVTTYPRFVLAGWPSNYLAGHLVAAGYRVIPLVSRFKGLYYVERPETR